MNRTIAFCCQLTSIKVCLEQRNGFAAPTVVWSLVLAPTLLLLIPTVGAFVQEREAERFLRQEAARHLGDDTPLVTLSSVDDPNANIFEGKIALALAALKERRLYYGLTIAPSTQVVTGPTAGLAAMTQDAQSVYRLIKQNIQDAEAARSIGSALFNDTWILDVRYRDALARGDLETAQQTLIWLNQLDISQTDVQLVKRKYRWMQELIRLPNGLPAKDLRELSAQVLKPLQIEQRMRQNLESHRKWQLKQFRSGADQHTATDLRMSYEDVNEHRMPLGPQSVLAWKNSKLFTVSDQGPFAFSKPQYEIDDSAEYVQKYLLKVLIEIEYFRRLLWLGVAARLQEEATGKLPESLDELSSTDPSVPLLKTGVFDDEFKLFIQDEGDGEPVLHIWRLRYDEERLGTNRFIVPNSIQLRKAQ